MGAYSSGGLNRGEGAKSRIYGMGDYIRGDLCSKGLIFGGYFVLVPEYQHFKIHRYISLF